MEKEYKRICRLCSRRRRERGITQEEVAFNLNTTQSNISLFECCRNNNAVILIYYIRYVLYSHDLLSLKWGIKDNEEK